MKTRKMEKTLTLFLLLTISVVSNAQSKIKFEYDNAGNQISRSWCPSCRQISDEPIKDMSDLKEEDLVKFFPEDVISYYPNPVKEELFLKWELINDNKVSSIQLFSLNGQLLKSYSKLENTDNYVVNFQEYPQGVYNLLLVYINGDQKAIKIIKNQ